MKKIEEGIIKQKLDAAIKICDTFQRAFLNFNESAGTENCFSVYLATNENCAYFPNMSSFAGKDVLTVTGSGDQAFNAVYFGAESVETFDINYLSFLFYELKQAALLRLTRKEFLDFYNRKGFLSTKAYNKLSHDLKPPTRKFFDGLRKYMQRDTEKRNYEHAERVYHLSPLIEEFWDFETNLINNNPYLSSNEAFDETKQRLSMLKKPVLHKFCPAHALSQKFEQKDIVILSNILSYYIITGYTHVSNKPRDVFRSVAGTLKDGGLASLLYEYADSGLDQEEESVLSEEYGLEGRTIALSDAPKTDRVYVSSKEEISKIL